MPEIADIGGNLMPGGRPTDYRPEYCDAVVRIGEQGKTLTFFAASVGQGRATVYRWIEAHPEFRDACDRARAAFQSYWETRFDVAAGDRQQNSSAILTFMQSTCPDFRPQAVVEHRISGQVQVRSLPRQELERLAGQAIQDAEIISEQPAQISDKTS